MMSETITMDRLQDLARAGELRIRAFGETHVFGATRPYGGNLAQAAADLPDVLSSGLARLYEDEKGLFIGPNNPRYVASDLPAEGGGE